MKSLKQQTVVILSVSSDIGFDLAKRYLQAGYRVVGTYRSQCHVQSLKRFNACKLFYCDLLDNESIKKFLADYARLDWPWEIFISCVGHPQPLTAFLKTDFLQWEQSVSINAIKPLAVLHGLYPRRVKGKICAVVFFAGGGTNNTVVDFSAYTLSKIMLIKMCEFLDAESQDLNIFIVGPGWTKTKTHYKILYDPSVSPEKSAQTREFLKTKKGTPLRDIYQCIEWLRSQGRRVAGGRNFSVVYDPWKASGRTDLAQALAADPDMYKLRRHRNDFNNMTHAQK